MRSHELRVLNREIGSALRRRRAKLGMSQTKMASKLGVMPTYLSRVETGKATVSLDLLVRAAQIVSSPIITVNEEGLDHVASSAN